MLNVPSLAATSEQDYIPLSAVSLMFPNGSTTGDGDRQCVNITIIDDTIKEPLSSGEGPEEPPESFSVRLNITAGAAIADNDVMNISIGDNDCKLISAIACMTICGSHRQKTNISVRGVIEVQTALTKDCQ